MLISKPSMSKCERRERGENTDKASAVDESWLILDVHRQRLVQKAGVHNLDIRLLFQEFQSTLNIGHPIPHIGSQGQGQNSVSASDNSSR